MVFLQRFMIKQLIESDQTKQIQGGGCLKYNAVIRWLGCGIMAVSLLVCPLFLVREGDRKSRNNRKGSPPQRSCCANLGTHTFAEDIPVCLSGCYTDEDCKL